MRPATVAALRDYYQDTDDATAQARAVGGAGEPETLALDRLPRLLLRALREIEQDRQADRDAAQAAIQALRQRVAALEARRA